jgi:Zn-dependent protease
MSDPSQSARAATLAKGGISLVFIALLVVFAGAAYELAIGRGGTIGVFVFVFIGWIISLCLHEWGHAATAWAGGDKSVAELGYLTLNPIRYANPLMSIGLPLLFLAMGGIGFPGGAVYVNRDKLRGPLWRAAMSAAGPSMNLLCLVAIGLVLRFAPMNDVLFCALSFLAVLQASALVLNLLPIPGLDGFGILETILPAKERDALAPISRVIGLVLLVSIYMVPQLFQPIWQVALGACHWLGIQDNAIWTGYDLFRFWHAS